MTNRNIRTFRLREERLFHLALGSAFCAALFFLFLLVLYLDPTPFEASEMFNRNPVLVYAGGRLGTLLFVGGAIAGLVAFSTLFVLFVRKRQDKSPGIVLDAAGMLDNSSIVSVGFIPWSDIVGVEFRRFPMFRGLLVTVADPEKYSQGGNALTRFLRRAAIKSHGSPIIINGMLLTIRLDVLMEAIQHYHGLYGRP